MDCGSPTNEVIKVVESNTKKNFIRAMRCDDLSTKIKEHKEWIIVLINDKKVAVASIYDKPLKEDTEYRYVVCRELNPTGKIVAFRGDSILTEQLLLMILKQLIKKSLYFTTYEADRKNYLMN